MRENTGMAGDLVDPGRSQALAALGLGARADAEMEYFARRVRDRLGVPVALVSLVQADRQVFPGQCGLSQPWAGQRSTPLSHSFCLRVVRTQEPLVITDARVDPRVAGNLAIEELEVVAYAGIPLTDTAGHVLGSLCAIDHQPRAWTDTELATLRELARACSTELRLRLARYDAEVERVQVQQVLRRAQLLLTAAEDLADAASVVELRDTIDHLVAGDLKPTRVELLITQALGRRATHEDQHDPTPGSDRPTQPGQWAQFDPSGPLLTAQVVREKRLIHHADLRATEHSGLAALATRYYLDAGLVAVAAAPIIGVHDVLGVLEFAWDQPHEPDLVERAVIAGLASYVATALQRVRFLQSRVNVARDLQDAMLTDPPPVTGLDIAARYRPAAASEQVGGDWYDAFPLPHQTPGGTMALVVGDVAGHDIHAATIMGQLRAMLRQACWDRQPHGTPATALTHLDHAAHGLGLATLSTAVLAYLHPHDDGTRRWSLTWSSAGHPPPILVRPDRSTSLLDDGDKLLGVPHITTVRHDHRTTLDPGSTLLLYTDGLVERRRHNIDTAIATLTHAAAQPAHTAAELVEHILTTMTTNTPTHDDDVVILAVHIPLTLSIIEDHAGHCPPQHGSPSRRPRVHPSSDIPATHSEHRQPRPRLPPAPGHPGNPSSSTRPKGRSAPASWT